MNIDEHMLRILATSGAEPVTINHLAHQLGISLHIVLPAARRLVSDGLANPSFVEVHGIPTLHALIACPIPTGA